MKKIIILVLASFLFFLASCKGGISAIAPVQIVPDKLSKDTTTSVVKETIATVPAGTQLKTDKTANTEASLVNETVIQVGDQNLQNIILSKNTKISLPPSTILALNDPSKMSIGASSEIILPSGTEVNTAKINWYALVFSGFVTGASIWYMIHENEKKKAAKVPGIELKAQETPVQETPKEEPKPEPESIPKP